MSIVDTFTHKQAGGQHNLLDESVSKWLKKLRKEDKAEGFQKLADTWGITDVISSLAKNNWSNSGVLADELRGIAYFNHKKRPAGKKLTIAAYYRSIKGGGGAERVVVQLCNIWSKMKDATGEALYRVILITDDAPEEYEYPLDKGVERAFLPPHMQSAKKNYRMRAEAWEQILSGYSIDIVVYGLWSSPCCFWDMLCVKGHKTKPAFLIHTHSFCAMPFLSPANTAFDLAMRYCLCDGVVVLSECDKRYTSAFCPNTKFIPNMLTFSVKDTPHSSREENTLLWCARISPTKQPLDVVRMMEYVVQEIPDAKLYIVGDGSKKLTAELKDLIVRLHLENNIMLEGFAADVAQYYREAAVFIGTSVYEGYWLALGEAMSYGIPIVSYDLPWLPFMQDGRGIITVEQKRYDLLAREVISLLRDPGRARKIGEMGRAQAEDLDAVDIGAEWKEMFENIGVATPPELHPNEKILYEYLCRFQQEGRKELFSEFGRTGTFILQRIAAGIRYWRDFGFVDTIKRFIWHIGH